MAAVKELFVSQVYGVGVLNPKAVPVKPIEEMPTAQQYRIRVYLQKHNLKLPCTIPDEVIDGEEGWMRL